MIKADLDEAFEYLKRTELIVEKIKFKGMFFTSDNLIVLYDTLVNDRTLFDCFELDIKYYLSRRKALIVLLEEDYFDKNSYNFIELKRYENKIKQRFKIKNNAKKDLDTPEKVHPKNPCKYFKNFINSSRKKEYKNALNEILDTPFYFFEVKKAIETLRATRKKIEDNDC
jgi:hypothetical protein